MSFPFRSDSDPFVVFFSSRTFSSKWERRWYTRIVLFKCLLLAKDPTSTIGRSPGYSNKLCFMWFSHVTTSVPIRSIRNGSVKHSIREPGLYSSVWYSFSFGSWNHIQQWLEQLAKSNHFTYFIAPNRFSYLYWNRMVSCSFIDWLFLSVRISFSNCGLNEFTRLNGQLSAGPSDCFPRMLSRVCKPCIWEELKRRAFGLFFAPCFGLAAIYLTNIEFIFNYNESLFLFNIYIYICPISSGGGTNQARCMSSDPTSDSVFPTYLTPWQQLFRWYPEIEEIEFLPGTHETKIWTR